METYTKPISNPINYEHKMAVFFDGPNMATHDKQGLNNLLGKYGLVQIKEVFIKKDYNPREVAFYIKNGFTPKINRQYDLDIDYDMKKRVREFLNSDKNDSIDLIVLGTQDKHFVEIAELAKEKGKRVLVIGSENFSMNYQLKAEANYFESLEMGINTFKPYKQGIKYELPLKKGQFKHIKQAHFAALDERMM